LPYVQSNGVVQRGGTNVEKDRHDLRENDDLLPLGLAKPARRALTRAGYSRLEQFTKLSKEEILQLHGMGPKALDQICRALAAKGLSFADGSRDTP
jgi:DNA-directed RNA polymerase alpha subunit